MNTAAFLIPLAIAVVFASLVGKLARHWLNRRLSGWDIRRQVRRNYRAMSRDMVVAQPTAKR